MPPVKINDTYECISTQLLFSIQSVSVHGWISAFFLSVKLHGAIEKRVSHFMSGWLRMG